MNYNTFKNDRIVKQKKLYGYKIVAMVWKNFETQISKFKCFLTTFSTRKSLQFQLHYKTVEIWIWISNFCETWSLGHGLSGTMLTLLWNPVVKTQSGWACSSICSISAALVQYAHVLDLAKLSSQRPHTARWPSFFCSGACTRWYGTHKNHQEYTGTDHGGYRFEKVTKISEN